jgi:Flp pilus assembly protein TadG
MVTPAFVSAPTTTRRAWSRRLGASVGSGRSGIAALEFCIIAPVLIFILAALVDLGNVMWLRMRLETSVSAATNYALANASTAGSQNGAALSTTMAQALGANLGAPLQSGTVVVNNGFTVTINKGIATVSGNATNADSCYCPTGSSPSWSWGSAVGCGSTCANGGYAGKYVTVTETQTYTPIFRTYGMVPNNQISAAGIVQVQ